MRHTLLLAALAGCQGGPDLCPDLEIELARCDLRPEAGSCGDLSQGEVAELLEDLGGFEKGLVKLVLRPSAANRRSR